MPRPISDVQNTNRPQPRSTMAGSAASESQSFCPRYSASMCSHASLASAPPPTIAPALPTTMSHAPNVSLAVCTARSHPACSATES